MMKEWVYKRLELDIFNINFSIYHVSIPSSIPPNTYPTLHILPGR